MIPLRTSEYSRSRPVVTWTLIALNLLIYLWDRGGALDGPNQAFADLALHPGNVVDAVMGRGDPADLAQLFTAMFLHGNLMHLLGNMVYLFAFGPNVEAALGSARFGLFYLFWGVCAFAAQILVEPHAIAPVLGASGAIGGVLGAYFVLFPSNTIRFIVPPLFWLDFEVSAFWLLGIWFVLQVVFPQDGVATWAHAGGFAAGMATVLALGGKRRLVDSTRFIHDEAFGGA